MITVLPPVSNKPQDANTPLPGFMRVDRLARAGGNLRRQEFADGD